MDLLRIYLQDHLAGSTAGLELAKRAEHANHGSDFGAPLAELRREIEEDRESLIDVARRLGYGRDRLKEGFGWTAEKAGRLKLNGRLRGYSPLSRVVEIEGLSIGVNAKRECWRTLRDRHGSDARLADVDLRALLARAEAQMERIDALQSDATALAFG